MMTEEGDSEESGLQSRDLFTLASLAWVKSGVDC